MATPGSPIAGLAGGGEAMAASPVGRQIIGALMARSQQAGNPGAAVNPIAAQASAQQRSDPTQILKGLEKVRQALGIMFVLSMQEFPNLANAISDSMRRLSRAQKEAQQASNVSQAVKTQNIQQIQNSAISKSAGAGNGGGI